MSTLYTREKCSYADRYKAKRAPTCGCRACGEKWMAAKEAVILDVLKNGMAKKKRPHRITVNAHKIKSNAKHGTKEPVVRVEEDYKTVKYGERVKIFDRTGEVAGYVVYSPDKPMACGAKVWVEAPYGTEVVS